MMKPIEAGCMAIVINSRAGNNGICLTVLEYIGEVAGYHRNDFWRTDTLTKGIHRITKEAGKSDYYMSEFQLMRIDGGEFETEQESKEKVNETH